MITKLTIAGMTCEHCERAVSRALFEVPGVERVVEVNRHRREALVEGIPNPSALVDAVREEGYDAEVAE